MDINHIHICIGAACWRRTPRGGSVTPLRVETTVGAKRGTTYVHPTWDCGSGKIKYIFNPARRRAAPRHATTNLNWSCVCAYASHSFVVLLYGLLIRAYCCCCCCCSVCVCLRAAVGMRFTSWGVFLCDASQVPSRAAMVHKTQKGTTTTRQKGNLSYTNGGLRRMNNIWALNGGRSATSYYP